MMFVKQRGVGSLGVKKKSEIFVCFFNPRNVQFLLQNTSHMDVSTRPTKGSLSFDEKKFFFQDFCAKWENFRYFKKIFIQKPVPGYG